MAASITPRWTYKYGCPENDCRPRPGAEGTVEVCLVLAEEFNVVLHEQQPQLASRQHIVHIANALDLHFCSVLFVLLGCARHDRHVDDFFWVKPHALRPDAFDDGPQHLLRRLAARDVREQVGVVLLQEENPGRTAGSELRQGSAELFASEHFDSEAAVESFDEFRAFFQDAQVGAEVGVQHEDVGSKQFDCSDDFVFDQPSARHFPEFLRDGGPDGRRH